MAFLLVVRRPDPSGTDREHVLNEHDADLGDTPLPRREAHGAPGSLTSR
jgi:hypothetical protein